MHDSPPKLPGNCSFCNKEVLLQVIKDVWPEGFWYATQMDLSYS